MADDSAKSSFSDIFCRTGSDQWQVEILRISGRCKREDQCKGVRDSYLMSLPSIVKSFYLKLGTCICLIQWL